MHITGSFLELYLGHVHGKTAEDFGNVSDCIQLISGPTHQLGNYLDLVFTDAPGLLTAAVHAHWGSSDH